MTRVWDEKQTSENQRYSLKFDLGDLGSRQTNCFQRLTQNSQVSIIRLQRNATTVHACKMRAGLDGGGRVKIALSLPLSLSGMHSLHAQSRGDDVEPQRKCPRPRQSSHACPSRLAASDHPFQTGAYAAPAPSLSLSSHTPSHC